jgi:muramoyltetrapeptide carboxypeptidase
MTPPSLQPGDKIAIVAFAKKITFEEISPAVKVFKSWGLEVVIGETIGAEWNQFGGNDELRRMDIQTCLNDHSIKAIISARGGYGSVRIIDKIDFSAFIEKPKWLIGFSDITVFHTHINQNYKLATVHGTMPVFFKNKLDYSFQTSDFDLCQNGNVNAEIVGGNLSILFSVCGSKSHIDTTGKILFIEDLCEYLYHTDRMLFNLKRNGVFDNLAGLIIGKFTDMKDGPTPFGKPVEEMIFDFAKHLDIPIFTGFPAGHIKDNRTLLFGEKINMSVTNGEIKLNYN